MKQFLNGALALLCVIALAFTVHMLYPAPEAVEETAAIAPVEVRTNASGQEIACRGGVPEPAFTGFAEAEDRSGWRYVENGAVDKDFCGFAEGKHGWWYVEDGRVQLDRNDILEGLVNGERADWYVSGGQVMLAYTGLTDYTDSGVCRYVENGKAVPYTGFARNARGWWYAENGRVDFSRTGLIPGEINGEEALWFVSGGQAQLLFRGLADAGADGDGWYVLYGRVQSDFTGIVEDGEGFRFCRDGRVDDSCRDALSFDGADWLIEGGQAEQVTTEDQKTVFRAFQLVKSITDESMTKEEKLRVCFDYVKSNYRECNPRIPHLKEEGWHIVYANDLLDGEGGNCFSYGAAFAYIARAIGFENVYACNSGNHGWAEIEGRIYDPEWSLHSGGYDYYGLSYNSPAGESYRRGLGGWDWPGREWVYVKLS